ncbi:PREDICTED: uncharacterized protein LOC108770750 [Trachymyrmex cornetzi]|nr:PREDICTED: uncharacterized protein LOC108770750 [Trachymyrmex cornetzi]
MTDGSTVTVPRKKSLLKEDAVPSIFPMPTPAKSNFYYVNSITEKKQQEKHNEGISTVTPTQNLLQRPVSIPDACVSQNPVAHNSQDVANGRDLQLQTWAGMISDLKNLTLPSEYWISVFQEEFAMWTCWIDDLSVCQRNVILAKNMTYRVSIYKLYYKVMNIYIYCKIICRRIV